MYNEILSFRDTMFELYNSHIEQIEEFVNSADSFSERMDELYPDENKAQDTEDMTKADDASIPKNTKKNTTKMRKKLSRAA